MDAWGTFVDCDDSEAFHRCLKWFVHHDHYFLNM